MVSAESQAMPVQDLAGRTSATATIDKVWCCRYGFGWRRPYYGYGWGWRRPYYGYRYGWGWRRPYWGWRRW